MAGSPPKSPPPPAPFPSHPSARELIESYLRPRVTSGEKAGEFIHEADVYAAAPDVLTRQFPAATAGDGREAWYFFTELKLKGTRSNRTVDAGEGRWAQDGTPKFVFSNPGDDGTKAQIGERQRFAFARKEDDRQVRSEWLMVELRLHHSDRHVLCKVYRSLGDPKAKADGGSPAAPMAGARGREEGEEEEIDAETAARAMADSLPKCPPATATFASHPSDAALIESHLSPWIVNGEKAGEFIHEADPYSAAPDDLTNQYAAATASDGRKAWYFLTKLRIRNDRVKRTVDPGGTWRNTKPAQQVRRSSDDGDGSRVAGQSQTFVFARKEAEKQVHLGWVMVELRIGATDLNALCKVYRSMRARKDGGSPVAAMAGTPGSKEADGEASTAAADREDDEEIDAKAEATAGIGLKRKAGDKGSGADTAAGSPGRQEAVGESPGDGELWLWDDSRASHDAAEEEIEAPAEPEEPNDPSKPKFYKFF